MSGLFFLQMGEEGMGKGRDGTLIRCCKSAGGNFRRFGTGRFVSFRFVPLYFIPSSFIPLQTRFYHYLLTHSLSSYYLLPLPYSSVNVRLT